MLVEKFTNSIFSSNTYIIYREEDSDVWLVDPGDSHQIFEWLKAHNKKVKGILLTHYHIDHIYGTNDFCIRFPELVIYTSKQSLVGLFSEKLNQSYYLEMPFKIAHHNIVIVDENSKIELYSSGEKANILHSPGHNDDCISFAIEKYLFTGDALIPGVKVHTKSKHGSKKLAHETINKIIRNFQADTIICPGHKETCLLKDLEINKLIKYNF